MSNDEHTIQPSAKNPHRIAVMLADEIEKRAEPGLDASSGNPVVQSLDVAVVPAGIEIGDALKDGPSQGWVFCRTGDGKPFLVAPADNCVSMWAVGSRLAPIDYAALPSKDQLLAMFRAREAGALKGSFNLSGLPSAGFYWCSMQLAFKAWRMNFSDGSLDLTDKWSSSSIRYVRPCSIK